MDLKKPEMVLSVVNTIAITGSSAYFYNRLSKVDQETSQSKEMLKQLSDQCSDVELNNKKLDARTGHNLADINSNIKRFKADVDNMRMIIENQQECIEILCDFIKKNVTSSDVLQLPKYNKAERYREYETGRTVREPRYREREAPRRRYEEEEDDFDPDREIDDTRRKRKEFY